VVSTTVDTHCGEGIVEVQLPSTPAFPLSQLCLRFSPSPGRVHTHGKFYRSRRGPKRLQSASSEPPHVAPQPSSAHAKPKKFPGPSSKSTFPEGGGGGISAKAALAWGEMGEMCRASIKNPGPSRCHSTPATPPPHAPSTAPFASACRNRAGEEGRCVPDR